MSIADIGMRELEKALRVLRVQAAYFLEYRDSGIDTNPQHHHSDTCAHADPGEAAKRLRDYEREKNEI